MAFGRPDGHQYASSSIGRYVGFDGVRKWWSSTGSALEDYQAALPSLLDDLASRMRDQSDSPGSPPRLSLYMLGHCREAAQPTLVVTGEADSQQGSLALSLRSVLEDRLPGFHLLQLRQIPETIIEVEATAKSVDEPTETYQAITLSSQDSVVRLEMCSTTTDGKKSDATLDIEPPTTDEAKMSRDKVPSEALSIEIPGNSSELQPWELDTRYPAEVDTELHTGREKSKIEELDNRDETTRVDNNAFQDLSSNKRQKSISTGPADSRPRRFSLPEASDGVRQHSAALRLDQEHDALHRLDHDETAESQSRPYSVVADLTRLSLQRLQPYERRRYYNRFPDPESLSSPALEEPIYPRYRSLYHDHAPDNIPLSYASSYVSHVSSRFSSSSIGANSSTSSRASSVAYDRSSRTSERHDDYNQIDPASLYRDTEPAWRRPRSGSQERRSRPTSIAMHHPRRHSTRDSGPPPSTRGFDKINLGSRRPSILGYEGRLPRHPSSDDAVPKSTSDSEPPYSLVPASGDVTKHILSIDKGGQCELKMLNPISDRLNKGHALQEQSSTTPTKEAPRKQLADGQQSVDGKTVPSGARWTRIDRKLVNPEALERSNERFEERLDCIIVLRILTRDEVQELANKTKQIREERAESYERAPWQAYDRDYETDSDDEFYRDYWKRDRDQDHYHKDWQNRSIGVDTHKRPSEELEWQPNTPSGLNQSPDRVPQVTAPDENTANEATKAKLLNRSSQERELGTEVVNSIEQHERHSGTLQMSEIVEGNKSSSTTADTGKEDANGKKQDPPVITTESPTSAANIENDSPLPLTADQSAPCLCSQDHGHGPVKHCLVHMADCMPAAWEDIREQLPGSYRWDIDFEFRYARGCWTCMPIEDDEPKHLPLTIAQAPVVVPVRYQWPPIGGVNPPPDPRASKPIDSQGDITLEIIRDVFVTFSGCVGFYLLINGLLQVIVPATFDTTWASSHLPHRFGGLKVCYIEQTLEPTTLPSQVTTTNTSSSGQSQSGRLVSRLNTSRSSQALQLNDFIEARTRSTSKDKFAGRIGLKVSRQGETRLLMSTHVITEAILGKSILGFGMREPARRLQNNWNEQVEIRAGNSVIGDIDKTYDPAADIYPHGFYHDITLVKPAVTAAIQEIRSPIRGVGWLSRDGWSALRRQTSTLKILGETEAHRTTKCIKCNLPSEASIIGEGIFLNQSTAVGEKSKDHDLSTWSRMISRAILYRVSPDFEPPNGYSGVALYADGLREDGTTGFGVVGLQSFVQRSGYPQSFNMPEGKAMQQRLRMGRIAFYGAFQIPDELRKEYEIV